MKDKIPYMYVDVAYYSSTIYISLYVCHFGKLLQNKYLNWILHKKNLFNQNNFIEKSKFTPVYSIDKRLQIFKHTHINNCAEFANIKVIHSQPTF